MSSVEECVPMDGGGRQQLSVKNNNNADLLFLLLLFIEDFLVPLIWEVLERMLINRQLHAGSCQSPGQSINHHIFDLLQFIIDQVVGDIVQPRASSQKPTRPLMC